MAKAHQEVVRPKVSFIRAREVMGRLGVGKSTLYRMIAAGELPEPVRLRVGGRAVGWPEQEIDRHIEGRIAASRTGEAR